MISVSSIRYWTLDVIVRRSFQALVFWEVYIMLVTLSPIQINSPAEEYLSTSNYHQWVVFLIMLYAELDDVLSATTAVLEIQVDSLPMQLFPVEVINEGQQSFSLKSTTQKHTFRNSKTTSPNTFRSSCEPAR